MKLYNEMFNEEIVDTQAAQIAALRGFYTEFSELRIVDENDQLFQPLDQRTEIVVDEHNIDEVCAWLRQFVEYLKQKHASKKFCVSVRIESNKLYLTL